MRILHLTDTHLYGNPEARHYDRIDTTAALARVLERVADVEGVDAVVHTGDASEDGTTESYRLLHAMLEPFAAERGAALAVVMGNHDAPAQYAQVAGPGAHQGRNAQGVLFQDRVVQVPAGGRILVLDTTVPGRGYGHVEPEQLAWLREELARSAAGGTQTAGGASTGGERSRVAGGASADGPTVLALHHPPLPAPTPLMAALDLDGLDELADVLRGSAVRGILAGHYHHAQSGMFAGIPVHVAPGITNLQDPTGHGGRARAHALSGVSIVDIDAAGMRTSSAVWPNAGDTRRSPEDPVHDFDPATVERIIAEAGRHRAPERL